MHFFSSCDISFAVKYSSLKKICARQGKSVERMSRVEASWGEYEEFFFSIFPMMMSLYKHIGAIEDDEDCREKWVRVSEEWKTRKKSMEKKLVVVKYTIAIAVRRASLARSNCTLLRSMKIYGKNWKCCVRSARREANFCEQSQKNHCSGMQH